MRVSSATRLLPNQSFLQFCITAIFSLTLVSTVDIKTAYAGLDSVAGSDDYAFGTGTCTPYEHLGELDGSERRTMTFVYHRLRDSNGNYTNGYLVENVHRNGHLKVWDISDPTNPSMLGEYGGADGDFFMGGHHNYTGMGAVMSWNKSGFSQVDLNDIPNWPAKGEDIRLESYIDDNGTYHPDKPEMAFDRSYKGNFGAEIWCPDSANMPNTPWVECDMNMWYPLGVRRTPMPYGYIEMNTVHLHDLRTPNTYASDGTVLTEGNEQISSINIKDDVAFEGGINIIGNLLIVRGFNETDAGVAIYDISNPNEPALLDSLRTRPDDSLIAKSYNMTTQWNGFIVIGMNTDTGFEKEMDIIDFRDPTNLKHVYHTPLDSSWGWSTRYPQFKDEHMFIGTAKVDMTPLLSGGAPVKVGNFSEGGNGHGAWGSDLLPIGNLLVSGGQLMAGGARIYCNEATPDVEPPTVSWTWPPADNINNVNMHVKSRIGLLVHEQLDWNTVNETNFQIRKTDGTTIPAYVSWNDNQTINVSPKQDLDAGTNYELIAHAGGFRDIAGNAIAEDFVLPFSTGSGASNSAPNIDTVDFVNDKTIVNTNETVQITISASDQNGDDLEYGINWGDGTEQDDLSTNVFSHSYTTPGIYTIQITADDDDFVDSESIKVVVRDPSAQNHTNASSIVYDENTNLVLNVNPDNDTVTGINSNTNSKVFETTVGKDPRSIAVTPTGEFWVTNYDDGTVSILNSSGSLIDTLDLPSKGGTPVGILTDNTSAYVSAESAGKIYKINLVSKEIIELDVGPRPYAMTMNEDKTTLLVTRFVSPENHGEIYKINLNNFSLAATIQIQEISGEPELQTFSNGVPNYLTAITFTPDGTKALIGSKKDNVRRGMISGLTGGSNAENTFRSMISMIDVNANQEVMVDGKPFHIDIDNHEMASSLTFAHGGQVLYVTHRGNNDITAYNAQSFVNQQQAQQLHRRDDLSRGPIGIAINDKNVYIHNFMDREVAKTSIFTRTSDGALSSFEVPTNISAVANEKLSSQVLLGKQLFYSASDTRISKDGYLSCAGCHNDGGSDERKWDFTDRGEGIRNTISLKGRAGTGHGNVHWSANFDEIQDFENDIRGNFGGTGLMSDSDFANTSSTLGSPKAGLSSDLDALAAYVTSLTTSGFSPFRNNDGSLNTNVVTDLNGDGNPDSGNGEIGKSLFEEKGCANCHSGSTFTDSPSGIMHDVGTITSESGQRLGSGPITAIDTPTLIGLWETAPYLHDGSADSLVKVLENTNHVGSFTNNERNDLAAYLLQIDGNEDSSGDEGGGDSGGSETFELTLEAETNNGATASNQGTFLANFTEGKYVQWNVDLPASGDYTIEIWSSGWGNGSPILKQDNINKGSLGTTGGTNSWGTGFQKTTATITLNAGQSVLRFEETSGNNYELDYIKLSIGTSASETSNDQDNDGVIDSSDSCANTPSGESVNNEGCSSSQIDSDGDGVMDNTDQCANTPNGENVDANGCPISEPDSDGDGVIDSADSCANTPNGENVNSNGCSNSQLDDDNDGVANNADSCANTPNGESVNSNGCSNSQLDDDNDGVNNNADQCPNTTPGANVDSVGCEIPPPSSGECNATNAVPAANTIQVNPGDCYSFNVSAGNLRLGTWQESVTVSITDGPRNVLIENQGWSEVATGTGIQYIKIESGTTSLQFGGW